ncbi:MAG: anaerobic ribonucleoside-triphosphate reductase activating protein [Oscillospiraceae bacterium]|nr:anaerobic ribonucleoside-triphosphate reductase activating protein [Oscillospiraceae bacterium]
MKYAQLKKRDVANGPGVRVSLFVSGCTHHCKGCFNPETWDFDYGNIFDEKIQDEIISLMEPSYIRGLTVLGGEPMEKPNQKALLPFIEKVREKYPEKDIWFYTGYTFETDFSGNGRAVCEKTDKLLSLIDVLVDGEFIEEKKNLRLHFRGSENQRIIDVKQSLLSGKTVLMDI